MTGARPARIEALLFAIALLAFAYFHQGGGWSQNARFAMIRAMVESGSLAIDPYLIYRASPAEGSPAHFARIPIHSGEVAIDGTAYALVWGQAPGGARRVDGEPSGSQPTIVVSDSAASGDLAFADGHFYPNKAPGAAFLAVPSYLVLFHLEKLLGADPDAFRTLTLNAWLTSVFSVGLLSALGCVLFYRTAAILCGRASGSTVGATLTLALGTMYFPYATTMYEHNVVAVCVLAAFYFALRAKAEDRAVWSALAGGCAGWAAIANYVTAAVAFLIAGYIVLTARTRRAGFWFGLGVLVPLLLLGAYNVACFDTLLTTNYKYENPMFVSSNMFLGVFVPPDPAALLAILFSPFRGLFFTSPVLLAAILGWVELSRARETRGEARLAGAVVAVFLLFNVCFYDWEGGNGVGPRYLAPAVPLLALGLVIGFQRFRKTTLALALVSIAMTFVIVAVDPQCPVAEVPGRPQWLFDPLTEYEVPLLVTGRPGPILAKMVEAALTQKDRELSSQGVDAGERAARKAAARERIQDSMSREDGGGFALAAIRGPVSANPQGIYEGQLFHLFPAGSAQAKWNSFNAGELLFPNRALSLLPLGVACAFLSALALRERGH